MTQFRIWDQHKDQYPKFFDVPRRLWKGLITRLNREGKLFRTGTQYEDGVPVKTLTILKRKS